jgi:adenylate cyclase class IV
LEAEVKLELSAETYQAILEKLSCSRGTSQTNRFLDTPDRRLRAAGWALRLRSEETRWFLTVKGAKRPGLADGQFLREEMEIELDAGQFRAMSEGFRLGGCSLQPCTRLVRQVGDLVVEPLYHFHNERVICRFGEWVLEVDKTVIGQDVFRELEVETSAERVAQAQRALRQWFESEGWEFTPALMSKMARAEKWYAQASGV